MSKYNVWMSVLVGDGKSARKKYILCNGESLPLLFKTQLEALKFWTNNKEIFVLDNTYGIRATPQNFIRISPMKFCLNLLILMSVFRYCRSREL